jgi:hypothetical protein
VPDRHPPFEQEAAYLESKERRHLNPEMLHTYSPNNTLLMP